MKLEVFTEGLWWIFAVDRVNEFSLALVGKAWVVGPIYAALPIAELSVVED